nr:hypothetical protein Iba_chr08fCG0770 [Ipomoea batatas]
MQRSTIILILQRSTAANLLGSNLEQVLTHVIDNRLLDRVATTAAKDTEPYCNMTAFPRLSNQRERPPPPTQTKSTHYCGRQEEKKEEKFAGGSRRVGVSTRRNVVLIFPGAASFFPVSGGQQQQVVGDDDAITTTITFGYRSSSITVSRKLEKMVQPSPLANHTTQLPSPPPLGFSAAAHTFFRSAIYRRQLP